jgi:hypothetical protein
MPGSLDSITAAEQRGSLIRRLHAFLAIALAVFLASVAFVGYFWHGYAMPGESKLLPAEPRPDPALTARELEKATIGLEVAQHKSKDALEAYEFANAALVEFVGANLKQLKDLENGTASGSNESTTVEQSAVTEINPRWAELRDQIAKLENRRTELLVTLMPSHPSIRYIELQLSDLQAQSKLVPEKIASAPAIAASEPNPKQILLQWHKVEADYHNLRERQSTARKTYDDTIASEAAARGEYDQANSQNLAAQAPPEKPKGEANPKTAIFVGALFAIGIAIPVALKARRNESTFRSTAEVRQALDLPVLGCLPRAVGEQPREQPLSEPSWIRRAIFGAELCVAAMVAWIAVAGIFDHQFLFDLLANPLAACSQKFWC